MRMADRPHVDYDDFMRITPPSRSDSDETQPTTGTVGARHALPGVHSFRAGRTAGNMAYKTAGIVDPLHELDFIELHDAYTSSEIQTYEDLGLCRYGEGGPFAASGKAFMPGIDYGLDLPMTAPVCPVNPRAG
jgi:acetyl-CoA C-acetyltransferase